MKTILISAVALLLTGCGSVKTIDVRSNYEYTQPSILLSPLLEKKWSHGSLDCDTNSDPAIDVFRYDHMLPVTSSSWVRPDSPARNSPGQKGRLARKV